MPSRIAGLSKAAIKALLSKRPRAARAMLPELTPHLAIPPAFVGADYDAWVDRLSKQSLEDTE